MARLIESLTFHAILTNYAFDANQIIDAMDERDVRIGISQRRILIPLTGNALVHRACPYFRKCLAATALCRICRDRDEWFSPLSCRHPFKPQDRKQERALMGTQSWHGACLSSLATRSNDHVLRVMK
ncbi:hypothetical protein [Rhizobium sp. NXC24]|uniref:hypothetical protein n=1 Tax=Rhizobium sp. NXC24 TaxID=2048897 RepID=UPI00131A4C4A|nr:hypothetical protein [Rhizobium sp. NXC24]